MSNNIREYTTIPDHKGALNLTATIQGAYKYAIQFRIGDKYVILAENQIKDLVLVLNNRLNNVKGFSATDDCDEKIITADVSK